MTVAINILVLDDEPFMLRLLERMLRQLGMTQVATFDSAYRALYELDHSERAPDLILLDLNMPDMDGVEFLRQLVERQYDGALILVSGEDEQILQSVEKLVQAHRITALGHLHKPVQPQALAALIEKWQPAAGDKCRVPTRVFGADDVRAAIDNGELVNHYQPKVALASGELVGVEALVRWRHPVVGLTFPDQFIGVAETHGLIDDLTQVVLVAGLEQASVWRKAGLALQLSVNVSMDNLTSLYFPDTVANLAIAKGIPPDSVMLEVTESRLSANLTTALDVLNRLRLKRFRLSIDDFGTGHSSLAQLRDIPFDELKVDRSFVHGAATNAKLRSIYSASLELGKQLHMKVVAEGVEDRADWDFLRQSECDLAQGYFIAKPMPAADIVGWLATWKARLSSEALAVV
jgi:EAL domain-containing protein (putative c-di-GMP-specific phosphodiesterase class I)/ActR/RegA family two-component response regulator